MSELPVLGENYSTVGTNKGQLILGEMGQIRELWEFPYSSFVQIDARIGDFIFQLVEMALFYYESYELPANCLSD